MALQEQLLGQARPSAADTPEELFTVGTGETYVMKGLFITNLTSSDVIINVYADQQGTTWDDTTVIIKDMKLPAGQFIDISTFVALANSSATVAVECDVIDGANFTGFGGVIT